MWKGVVGVVVVVAWAASAAAEPKSAAEQAIEDRMRAEVAAASPAAAEAFDRGNAARDGERFDEAIAAYRDAISAAPNVDHPHRRLCTVLQRARRLDEAVAECQRALELAPESPYDKAALASALVQRKGAGEVGAGLKLARDAADALPRDPTIVGAWCGVLMATADERDLQQLHECVDRLIAIDPDGLAANFLGSLTAAMDGRFDLGRERLAKAKAAGLSDEQVAQTERVLGDVEEASATFPRWLRNAFWAAVWGVAIWLGLMLVLLITGTVLSHVTLRTVARATDTSVATGNKRERRLRKLYRTVLFLSGVYFYLSMPILLATIVLTGGIAILAFFAIGIIPVKLVLLIAIVVLFTVGAIVRSLFVRVDRVPPGEPVDFAQHPKLRALLDEVAAVVGTHPVDVAYLTPGTDMAVTERGGLWRSVRGARTERSLIIGIALLEGMSVLQLRSILAHELGHFRNEDTAGGGFAIAVRLSLFALIVRMAQSGVAGFFNPVWWFLRGFHRMYLGISQGASRLQEVLADRWAIQAYGSAAFVAGYRHVVARSVGFEHDVDATLAEVIEKRRGLPNLYAYRPETRTIADADVASKIETELDREPTAYDSHPSPRQRIAWADQLAIARLAPATDDDADAWTLFADRDELERAMTTVVRERIAASHGTQISAVESAPVESPPPAAGAASDDGGWSGYGKSDD